MAAVRLAAALLAALWAAPARAAEAPPVEKLLESVVDFPAVPYRGELRVTAFWGGKERVHDALVAYAPGNKYRWEFLTPGGAVERVAVSDGQREELRLLGRHPRVLVGDPVGAAPREIDGDTEKALLLKNYVLASGGEATVSGRPAWVLTITPRERGKPRQELCIDEETGVVLESRRYQPDGQRAEVSRFLSFETGPARDEDFALSAAAATAPRHGLGPTAESSADVLKHVPPYLANAKELPFGFRFDGADQLRLSGSPVEHLRWTDGLVAVSLFVTDRPVRPSGRPAAGTASVRPLDADTGPARVATWRVRRLHYTLMANVSEPMLKALKAHLRRGLKG
ncbi:MAG: hypothetical protein KGL53_00500, partial [Elusimicrobia bacterium]|nr:hypothetical protein [Elusimicrobiota bacterium]